MQERAWAVYTFLQTPIFCRQECRMLLRPVARNYCVLLTSKGEGYLATAYITAAMCCQLVSHDYEHVHIFVKTFYTATMPLAA